MADEVLAWIQFGLDVERSGRKFYEECLKHSKDQRTEELFKYLIDEEKRHEEAFENLLEKKAGGDKAKIQASIDQYNKMGIDKPLFSKSDLDEITDPNTLAMEMFNKSADQEKKGINFYLDMEAKQTDPELKKFFHDLATQELVHKKKIVALGMSLLGMEEEDEDLSPEAIEKELSQQKVVFKEFALNIKQCKFEPSEIRVNKGETVVLKITSDSPAGLRMINFGVNEYISPGKEFVVKFLADTAGEFEFFSNVPCSPFWM